MTNMNKFLTALVAVFLLSTCDDNVKSFYRSFSEIYAASENEKAWLPNVLCENIDLGFRDLLAFHDLDTNRMWGEFYVYDKENFFTESHLKITDGIPAEWFFFKLKKMGLKNCEKSYVDVANNVEWRFFDDSTMDKIYFTGEYF